MIGRTTTLNKFNLIVKLIMKDKTESMLIISEIQSTSLV